MFIEVEASKFKFVPGVAANASFAAEVTPRRIISAPTNASAFTNRLFLMVFPCLVMQQRAAIS